MRVPFNACIVIYRHFFPIYVLMNGWQVMSGKPTKIPVHNNLIQEYTYTAGYLTFYSDQQCIYVMIKIVVVQLKHFRNTDICLKGLCYRLGLGNAIDSVLHNDINFVAFNLIGFGSIEIHFMLYIYVFNYQPTSNNLSHHIPNKMQISNRPYTVRFNSWLYHMCSLCTQSNVCARVCVCVYVKYFHKYSVLNSLQMHKVSLNFIVSIYGVHRKCNCLVQYCWLQLAYKLYIYH